LLRQENVEFKIRFPHGSASSILAPGTKIDVIPKTYPHAGTGCTSLEQASRIYNLDVIGLVSYVIRPS